MIISYDRSRVTGYRKDEKGRWTKAGTEDFVHLHQQDPILLACRRSREMAGCDRFDVETEPAASRWIDEVITDFRPYRAAAAPEYEY